MEDEKNVNQEENTDRKAEEFFLNKIKVTSFLNNKLMVYVLY